VAHHEDPLLGPFEEDPESPHETGDLRRPPVPRLVVPELDDITFGRFEGGPIGAYRA
jgi:hypothetical protein